jgi:hypothetical protein
MTSITGPATGIAADAIPIASSKTHLANFIYLLPMGKF